MSQMMNGLSKILERLRSGYFNLVATISEFLYTCRQGIARLILTVRSAGAYVVSTGRRYSDLDDVYGLSNSELFNTLERI